MVLDLNLIPSVNYIFISLRKSFNLCDTAGSFRNSRLCRFKSLFTISSIVQLLNSKISACFHDFVLTRKHGMEEYIAADPITYEHHALFKKLQNLSLEWRLADPFASLVSACTRTSLGSNQ